MPGGSEDEVSAAETRVSRQCARFRTARASATFPATRHRNSACAACASPTSLYSFSVNDAHVASAASTSPRRRARRSARVDASASAGSAHPGCAAAISARASSHDTHSASTAARRNVRRSFGSTARSGRFFPSSAAFAAGDGNGAPSASRARLASARASSRESPPELAALHRIAAAHTAPLPAPRPQPRTARACASSLSARTFTRWSRNDVYLSHAAGSVGVAATARSCAHRADADAGPTSASNVALSAAVFLDEAAFSHRASSSATDARCASASAAARAGPLGIASASAIKRSTGARSSDAAAAAADEAARAAFAAGRRAAERASSSSARGSGSARGIASWRSRSSSTRSPFVSASPPRREASKARKAAQILWPWTKWRPASSAARSYSSRLRSGSQSWSRENSRYPSHSGTERISLVARSKSPPTISPRLALFPLVRRTSSAIHSRHLVSSRGNRADIASRASRRRSRRFASRSRRTRRSCAPHSLASFATASSARMTRSISDASMSAAPAPESEALDDADEASDASDSEPESDDAAESASAEPAAGSAMGSTVGTRGGGRGGSRARGRI